MIGCTEVVGTGAAETGVSAVEKDECCMKTLQQALTVVCCASAVAAIGVDPP